MTMVDLVFLPNIQHSCMDATPTLRMNKFVLACGKADPGPGRVNVSRLPGMMTRSKQRSKTPRRESKNYHLRVTILSKPSQVIFILFMFTEGINYITNTD